MSQAQTCPIHWGCRGGPGPQKNMLVFWRDSGHPPHCPQPRWPTLAAHGPGQHKPGGRTRQSPGDGRGHFGVGQTETGPADVGHREQAQWLRSGPTHCPVQPAPGSAFWGCRDLRGKGQGWSPGIIPGRVRATVLASSLDWTGRPSPTHQRPGSRTLEATRNPEGELSTHIIPVPRMCIMRAHALTGKQGEAGRVL